jgi:anti-sigma B factor antagonist
VTDEAADRLQIVRNVGEGEMVFRLTGEVDPHTAPLLDDALQAHNDDTDAIGSVVLDLSAVTFLDSAGVRSIVTAHEALEADGKRLVVRAPSAVALRVLEIAGLTDYLVVE